MSNVLDRFTIRSMWNNSHFDFVGKSSNEKSGGIVAIWDTSVFTLLNSLDGEGFLALQGRWKNISISCLIIVVYAPQDQKKKKKLWSELSRLILSHNSLPVVMGDFNEVRYANEWKGSIFDTRGATRFKNFISSSGLIELPMGAKRFTRMNTLGNKLSKIDRILVSQHIVDLWPNSHTITLLREFSDHFPLLLSNLGADYGPIPFKLYNSWLQHKDF
ncbi:cytochrome P450 [Tanacetum coccineum]